MQMHFRAKPRAPDELGGVKIPYIRGRSTAHKVSWYLILLLVLSPIALLSFGVLGSWLTLTANGTVLLEQDEVRAARSGRIRALSVAAGDMVQAGKTLAVLDSLDLDTAAARNAIERQAAADARGSAAAQRLTALDELRLRERLVRYQQQHRAAIATLVDEGAATVAELNAAESAATEAEVGLLESRAAAERAGTISTADAEHDLIERERGALTVTASHSGHVLELLAREGEYVTPGEPLMIVARADNPRIVAYTSPKFGIGLKVGQAATIHFPNGARTLARVSEAPRLTQRMPADLVDQFGVRPMTVVLNLLPQQSLPDSQRVQGLPVSVRFHYDWESSTIGHAVGTLLGAMSR